MSVDEEFDLIKNKLSTVNDQINQLNANLKESVRK